MLFESAFTLLYKTIGRFFPFLDVQDKELQDKFERFYHFMEVQAELLDEEWFYDLVVEKNSLWYPLRSVVSIGFIEGRGIHDWELLSEGLQHVSVIDLECAHDILATKDEIHYASHHHPLGVLLCFKAER